MSHLASLEIFASEEFVQFAYTQGAPMVSAEPERFPCGRARSRRVADGSGLLRGGEKGPMRVDPRALDSISIGNPEVERLRSEAVTLYQEIVELRGQRPFTREDIPLIEAAIDALDPVLRSSDGVLPSDEKLLNELKRFKAAIKGRLLRERSASLAAEGERHQKEGDSVAAVSAFRKAAQLQRRINKQYPESEDRDHRRAAALFNRGFDLMARPLFESSSSEEQAARGHFQERRWKQAEQHMKEAISLQRELNEDHSRSRFAHHERLQRLEVGLASMQSGRLPRPRWIRVFRKPRKLRSKEIFRKPPVSMWKPASCRNCLTAATKTANLPPPGR